MRMHQCMWYLSAGDKLDRRPWILLSRVCTQRSWTKRTSSWVETACEGPAAFRYVTKSNPTFMLVRITCKGVYLSTVLQQYVTAYKYWKQTLFIIGFKYKTYFLSELDVGWSISGLDWSGWEIGSDRVGKLQLFVGRVEIRVGRVDPFEGMSCQRSVGLARIKIFVGWVRLSRVQKFCR